MTGPVKVVLSCSSVPHSAAHRARKHAQHLRKIEEDRREDKVELLSWVLDLEHPAATSGMLTLTLTELMMSHLRLTRPHTHSQIFANRLHIVENQQEIFPDGWELDTSQNTDYASCFRPVFIGDSGRWKFNAIPVQRVQ